MINFYCDDKSCTVDGLMHSLWDKNLGLYVLKEQNKRTIIGAMDQLRSNDLTRKNKEKLVSQSDEA